MVGDTYLRSDAVTAFPSKIVIKEKQDKINHQHTTCYKMLEKVIWLVLNDKVTETQCTNSH